MKYLPNGCSCSELSVHPSNWRKVNARVTDKWYIQFYFYDSNATDKKQQKKFCQIKGGLNKIKDLKERREAVTYLMNEIEKMLESGYNFIKGRYDNINFYENINPQTLLPEALEYAKNKYPDGTTKTNIEWMLRRIEAPIKKLKFENLCVKDVRRKHIRFILDECGTQGKKWSAQTYNHFVAYFSMLFSKLMEIDVCENNPVNGIKKMKQEVKFKKVLTPEERKRIDAHFAEVNIPFRNFIHIFFHSGARFTELLQVKPQDVDLKNGFFKVIVKKGVMAKEDIRPIKNIVREKWEVLLRIATENKSMYLFGPGLVPGRKPCTRDWITKYWQKEVKQNLKINKDFYSLKHLNLDQTAEITSITDAANMAGHTTPVITLKHYAFGEKERQLEKLKTINNPFA